MKNMLIATAIAAALSLPAGAYAATSPDDLAQIREQLQGLMQRVDKLEQENTALKTENEDLKAQDDYLKAETKGLRKDTATISSDAAKVKGADWASRIVAKGDLRYRHEQIKDPTRAGPLGLNDEDQTRHRIRARLGFDAKVTDTLMLGLQVATGGDDPRSSNQTLGSVNSRKAIGFDLAYFDWKFASWGDLIGGKMKFPFVRPGQSLFYDGDINPEGLAFQFNRGTLFGSAWASGSMNATTLPLRRLRPGPRPPVLPWPRKPAVKMCSSSAASSVRDSRSALRLWWRASVTPT